MFGKGGNGKTELPGEEKKMLKSYILLTYFWGEAGVRIKVLHYMLLMCNKWQLQSPYDIMLQPGLSCRL